MQALMSEAPPRSEKQYAYSMCLRTTLHCLLLAEP